MELAEYAEGEGSRRALQSLLEETPTPRVTVTANMEGENQETDAHVRPETAAEYLEGLTDGVEQYKEAFSLPDPDEFEVDNVEYEALAGDQLRYEISVTGHESLGETEVVIMDGDGNDYISSGGEASRYGESEILFEAETDAESVDEAEVEGYREIVEVLSH